MKKYLLLLSALLLLPAMSFAQSGNIIGKVIDRTSRQPIQGVEVTVQTAHPQTVVTDEHGVFSFKMLSFERYDIELSKADHQPLRLMVDLRKPLHDMGVISLTSLSFVPSNVDVDVFDDILELDSGDEQSMPAILSASKDVFDNVASYNFSSMRYRTRGYDPGTAGIYLNGIYFNDALTGYNPWSLWSGLNDATRTQAVTAGAKMSDLGPGGINGSTNIYATASQMRKGGRVSFVNSNRQYRFRVIASYASGLQDNGWSYAFSVSARQGGNDWVKGTYYDNWGYFASIEKNFSGRHNLALTVLGTPGERAIQGASTQEVYDLVGSNTYNPNWGYQDGKKRNARVRDNHEPIITLNYDYDSGSKFSLASAFSFRFGKNGYSALDWHGGQDPRPDYYRNLPSYFQRKGYEDPYKAELVREGWRTDWNIRQINWDKMYHANQNSYFEADGREYYNGVDPVGKRRSEIILQDRRTDQKDFRAAINFKQELTSSSELRGGINLNINRTEYFTTIKDLLGGDYYLDIDKYVERDQGDIPAVQSNMNTPNRLVSEGDKYGYDYYAHIQSQSTWLTYKLDVANWEINLGAETGFTRMWREGLYKKGLFPETSEGNSEKKGFWTYTLKAGLNYRLTGSQMIYANFSHIVDAPQFNNSFVSPRTRNEYVSRIGTEKTTSVDLNYELRLPSVKMRVTGYYTDVRDKMDVINFYDDLSGSFTNFSMSGIDELYTGVEVGLSVPLTKSLTATGVFSYGFYKYNSNPLVTQTRDNSSTVILKDEPVRWKDMKLPSTPQTAASIGLNYRGPKSIFASIDANFFDAMYLSMNPMTRTDKAMQGLESDKEGTPNAMTKEEKVQNMARQERFGSAFVLNASVGKTWFLPNGMMLGANFDVRNILNRKSIKTGGYEQLRFSKVSDNGEYNTHYDRFDAKYYYMYGTTYYLNVYLRF